jgi:hypothetical protein
MTPLEVKWLITIVCVLFWVWRMHALGFLGPRNAANQKIEEDRRKGGGSGGGPGFSLIFVSGSVGSWNMFSFFDYRLSHGATINSDTYQILTQYLILCATYLAGPLSEGWGLMMRYERSR